MKFSFISLLLGMWMHSMALAQTTYILSGKVTDAQTRDPIPFASIALKGTSQGTTSNFEGFYQIRVARLPDSLLFTAVGFASKGKAVKRGQLSQVIHVQLEPIATQLAEVAILSGENPAFAILRKVRENQALHNPNQLSAYQYEAYTRTEIDVDNLSDRFRKLKPVQRATTAIEAFEKLKGEDGKTILPVFLSESVSQVHYRRNPERKKETIQKTKVTGVGVKDGSFVSQLIGSNFYSYNFYDNYLPFLQKEFASPIGESWKGMYEWFLADSVWIDSTFCYELEFEPKRPQDLAFKGKLWIDKATYALKEIDASIGKDANLNYIEKIKIQQELAPTATQAWFPVKIRITVDIAEISKNSAGMLAKFYASYRHLLVNQPKPIDFYEPSIELMDDYKDTSPQFWQQVRHDSLTQEEVQSIAMIDSIRNLPVVRTYVEIADIAFNGWKKVGKFEVGPYLYLFAANPVEGLRTRIGFRTNADFSRKWVIRGMLGYGTHDQTLKYGIEVNHIFSRKRWTVVGMSHSFDIERVGITSEMAGNNKLFYAFTRFRSRGSFYQTENKVFAKSEVVKGITLSASLATQHFDPVGLPYYNFGYYPKEATELRTEYQDTRLDLEARFAWKENYIMDGNERITLATKRVPVVTFRYSRGLNNTLEGDFDYHRFSVTAYQTLRMGQLGRSSYRFSYGYTPSTIPYPLLFTHLGGGFRNPLYNRFAFNMMGFFEFVSDQYASLMWDHHFEGFLFNRLPGIAKLKWRLVASANVLYGSQRPENKNVVPSTDNKKNNILEFGALRPGLPYAEVGYGIDNIFKLLRIQAFHRLTYLNNPGVRSFGVKASVHFSF
jgi:hypothetical protein